MANKSKDLNGLKAASGIVGDESQFAIDNKHPGYDYSFQSIVALTSMRAQKYFWKPITKEDNDGESLAYMSSYFTKDTNFLQIGDVVACRRKKELTEKIKNAEALKSRTLSQSISKKSLKKKAEDETKSKDVEYDVQEHAVRGM